LTVTGQQGKTPPDQRAFATPADINRTLGVVTSSACANLLALSFSGFRNSSRKTSPGCRGTRFALEAMPALLIAHALSLLPCWPGFAGQW